MDANAPNILCRQKVRVDWCGDSIPLEELQRVFGELFDRTARVVHTRGYDQDDTVVKRHLICRLGDEKHAVEAAFISDATLLKEHLRQNLEAKAGMPVNLSTVAVVALEVIVTVDTGPSGRFSHPGP